MRKVFSIALAISAVLACSKTEVLYEPMGEITISPVNSNVTKSMMTDSDFLGSSFNVWSWYSPNPAGQDVLSQWQADFADDNKKPTPYIEEKSFIKKDEQNNKWGGRYAYYWPKVGSLVFAGYYAPNLTDGTGDTQDQVTYQFDGSNNVMTFHGVEQTKVVAPVKVNGVETKTFNEDIMYFNMTPNSYNYANNNVNLSFKHALSWITVTLAKCVDPRIDATITVKNVTFTNVAKRGTGTVNASSDIQWTIDKSSIEKECKILDKEMVIGYEENEETGTVATKIYTLDEYLFIPQNINGILAITYVVESKDHSAFTETYRVRLSNLKDETLRHDKWEPAKHYTYNLTIGTDEIRVQPSVETWGPKDTGINIPLPEDWYDKLENNGQSGSGSGSV